MWKLISHDMQIHPQYFEDHYYKITSANRTMLGNKLVECVNDRYVKFTLFDQTPDELIFQYTLIDQTVNGTLEIHDFAADMEWLQTPLYFIANKAGQFIGMDNLDNLLLKWNDGYRSKIATRYQHNDAIKATLKETDMLLTDKKRLLQTFFGYSHHRCLLRTFFNENAGTGSSSLNLKNFFGQPDLPLVLHTVIAQGKNQKRAESSAELDLEKLDKNAIARVFKDAINAYDLKIDMLVDMEEIFEFDGSDILQSADLFLEVFIPGLYKVTIAHQCKKISRAELPEVKHGRLATIN